MTIPLRADQRTNLRVEAAGHKPWALDFRSAGKDKRMAILVRMVPVESSAGPKT